MVVSEISSDEFIGVLVCCRMLVIWNGLLVCVVSVIVLVLCVSMILLLRMIFCVCVILVLIIMLYRLLNGCLFVNVSVCLVL